MKQRITLLLISILFAAGSGAQGYKINVNFTGLSDSTIYLAVHYGNEKFVRDTAVLDKKGRTVFTKDKPLAGGMYLLACGGEHLLDFLISDDKNQNFSLSATKAAYNKTLHFKNSPENEAFADFTRFMIRKQKRDMGLVEMSRKTKKDSEIQDYISRERQKYRDSLEWEISNIKRNFPNGLLYSIVSAMNPPMAERIDIPENTPGRDSILFWYYYNFEAKRYWDNFVLTDKRMQYSPILIPAIDRYFTEILIQKPDSIIPHLDRFLSKVAGDSLMNKFLTGHTFNLFMQSEIMGMENVAVHLIDNYYLAGKVNVLDDKFLRDITDYANKYRPTLIGKQAANLKMETINGQYESLYDIDAQYTLVYFFEPNCGHCKQETPKVYKVYEKYRDKGLAAYCVYSQTKKQEWAAYVAQNNLQWINVWDETNANDFRRKYSVYIVPQIYLLDKDKKIIGRRLSAETLDKMLGNLFKAKK
ncbi:MAG: AhpC/TSA family protein [Prevotellaceae bacterium]|jgi:thiol-disulfide isomerase/thioredoxin/predicted CopG family antitoxin|nr:AhpC/TSA family protein [Prevotellaceae bacterium]